MDTTQYTLQTDTTSTNCKKSVLIFHCRDTTQYTLQTHTTSRNCEKRVLIFSLQVLISNIWVLIKTWIRYLELKYSIPKYFQESYCDKTKASCKILSCVGDNKIIRPRKKGLYSLLQYVWNIKKRDWFNFIQPNTKFYN